MMMAFLGDPSTFTACKSPSSLQSESIREWPHYPSLRIHHLPRTHLHPSQGSRVQPPLRRAARRLTGNSLPRAYGNGRYQEYSYHPIIRYGRFFVSKERCQNLLAFTICTENLNKQSLRRISRTARGDHLVAACEVGDGNGYVSSTEHLGSSNGHASSVGDTKGLVQTSGSGTARDHPKSEGNMRNYENDSKGNEALDKAVNVEDTLSIEHLREMLQSAAVDLERARLNSSKVEEDAQTIAEKALALRDEASDAESTAEKAMDMVEKIAGEEDGAEELLSKARLLLAEGIENLIQAEKTFTEAREKSREMKEARSRGEADESIKDNPTQDGSLSALDGDNDPVAAFEKAKDLATVGSLFKEEEALNAAREEVKARGVAIAQLQKEVSRIQSLKLELEQEALRAKAAAKLARDVAVAAEEEVAQVMSLAEQAVALELDAAQKVCIAEMALQKAEKITHEGAQAHLSQISTQIVDAGGVSVDGSDKGITNSSILEASPEGLGLDRASPRETADSRDDRDILELEQKLSVSASFEAAGGSDDTVKKLDVSILQEAEVEKQKVGAQQKKENAKEPSPTGLPKSSTKRSSRFLPASFFSSSDDEEEFTLTTVFRGMKEHFMKVAVGALLLCAGTLYLKNRISYPAQLAERTEVVTSFEEVTTSARPVMRELQKLPRKLQSALEKIPQQEVNGEEASLFDVLWLLLASVIFVPIFQKLPGGSPVLGYLAAGVLIGPYSLSIIRHVHGTKAIAEFGVVFLLFNIGLELSVERLSSMKKYVFGLGTSQVFVTALVVGLVCHYLFGFPGPAALVVGNGLALSSTAVVLQVLQERGESTSRHGRATFSVLLFQDLAVVVLLILLPLISPTSSKGGVGFQAIAEALGVAAVKGVVAIAAIIAGGRLLLRPIYKRMAENHNAEIFAANTLFVVLGTSVLTARAGLSMALGAFLAGLLLAETEFALQVESDIAPYRGLLLGLFFMTVGMAIDPKLFVSKFPIIIGALSLLIIGKTALVVSVGRLFGLSTVAAVRAGLLLAPGGEFAFVAFGEAVNQKIMTSSMSSLLYLVVGLSMALTPWLGALGQVISSQFEQQDVRSLLPAETETDDLQDHIILCGFGRVGQIIAQLLSDRLIPFVALDVRSERVSAGRALDLPVYFGDAGSKEVLHKVGAERASSAVIALDTPGANFRAVWALSKHFPKVKTFVRAHDVEHGINLEKAGATAVVPETLEPSLQLAAAVLAQAKLPATEIAATIDEFRTRHMSELTELCEISGSCLGYGYSRIMGKPKSQSEPSVKAKTDDDVAGEPWQEALAVP